METSYTGSYQAATLLDKGVKPDTDLLYFHVDYDDTGAYPVGEDVLVTVAQATTMMETPLDKAQYSFLAPAYTSAYAAKAEAALDHYRQIKADVDSIRADDDQYDDPSLWSAEEQMLPYMEKNQYWNYTKWRY